MGLTLLLSVRHILCLTNSDDYVHIQVELTEQQAFKAHWLHHWAVQAGIALSHGEADEMVVSDKMPSELRELWQRKSSEQKAIDAINAAVAIGDLSALQVMPASGKGVARCNATH